ncbi:putative UDP-glucuronosyl/UDP-glucosyltransferase [Helianthus annuus]|uniref:UDP-glucuronosyl/UDP-glucosyltransferase n=1 Tax=Helianthus annuus TaxID=4232 RepID=A0A251V235_HELAN|nr:UDP-glycosyltransferase 83A1 [Helianthus annuus]KAF5763763.1 putative UDP-glucuronosyl/UDP-glucosyltransferase [Helianthus annuus]KAJ0450535.1 putative UDP-glucuronosyl/UDP-glucosyltransferase [Helianthus annuus]KAJ0472385.1 putative UDP-glucuronosyl/UDP-glucosyltransferase [Helianthus annuus]KAJ0647984.1 putative UDP-glucuronosyl/UDP-glucosyltransferase [Helianthus annuus]KAJ0651837.1 putative UDP-glucuronosyl/UDP-glucosyltransferase [Helianthus annuus]
MVRPHVLLLPAPAQGHVIPATELGQRLVKQGAKVTVINTEATHMVITKNWLENEGCEDLMQMVSIPDGLEPWEDRNELGKLMESMEKSMPTKLEQLIETINKQDDNKVTCLIVDFWLAWALQVVKKMEIGRVIFCPASTATLATMLSIPKLIDDGVINNKGIPQNSEMIRLTEAMPPLKPEQLLWLGFIDSTSNEVHFQDHVRLIESTKITEWFICNSSVELEPAAFSLFPELLPVGPLLASNRLADQAGHFWAEDSTCLAWLDQQPACSVLYIAFGSFTTFNQTQFEELALGLELTNRPFLWVVRSGQTKETAITFPGGYTDRVGSRGKIVSWAPQQKVLAHPSVACFMTHCGWNSTLEGVTNGLPFLCWPYFGDQPYNETYICDVWKTGLRLKEDKAGMITQEGIKSKVEQLLSDKTFKSKAVDLKEKVASSVAEGGSSHTNLARLNDWIHGKDAHTDLNVN